MDVDSPTTSALKRCSSAPTINIFVTGPQQMTSTQATNTSSRDVSPSSLLNIFTPRARRYSASFSPLAGGSPGPRLTPRVSQLRQEECADISNSREVNHEREVHSAMQMSQSWEDLTIVTENWSCKSDDLTNPLHVTLPSGSISCSSPSPTSRNGLRLPYGLSPSPTRKTFATRRSMSPIAMRPSTLNPAKRKFELDDNSSSNYSPPPLKKMYRESRGPSPICQTPSPICPSPDSGTYEGRTTPKLFISKLYTNSSSSSSSSPSTSATASPAMMDINLTTPSVAPATLALSSIAPTAMEATNPNNCDDNGDENMMLITTKSALMNDDKMTDYLGGDCCNISDNNSSSNSILKNFNNQNNLSSITNLDMSTAKSKQEAITAITSTAE